MSLVRKDHLIRKYQKKSKMVIIKTMRSTLSRMNKKINRMRALRTMPLIKMTIRIRKKARTIKEDKIKTEQLTRISQNWSRKK